MAQRPAALLVRTTIRQLLARWAVVDILRLQIGEVLLAEAAICLAARSAIGVNEATGIKGTLRKCAASVSATSGFAAMTHIHGGAPQLRGRDS
jgi:hypothetical protein